MPYPDIPHLAVPITFANGQAAVVEQDSTDEIAQCVAAIAAYRPGERIDDPEFGIPEQALIENGIDDPEILSAIDRYEPRADIDIETDTSQLEQLVETGRLNLRGTTSG